jgi:DHA1 family bicyclomycin/chloramphenicol resistance-like MFS transporter
MKPGFLRNAIVLGLMAAVGPFAIDMYLPAMPTIAAGLDTTAAATQMTLMVFFLSFGACQIFYGPASDMFGRKPPLYFGLIVFALGGVGCALAPTIEWLIFFRFVQGAGAAAVMVIPRAIIRDLHTGPEATQLMALIMLVFSVSPLLAPLLGSVLIGPFGWRAVFVAVTVVAGLAFFLVLFLQPETRPPAQRVKVSVGALLEGFGVLLRDAQFLGLTFVGGLSMSSFFAFLAGSSFVYIEHFGLTPTGYSVAFAINAVGFIGASQFAAKLGMRFGMTRVVTAATLMYMLLSVALFVTIAAGVDSLAVMMALIFAAFAFMGLVIPTTMVLALEEHGPIAGMASALGGTLQMMTGAVVIVAVSVFSDNTPLPMVSAIALCAVGAYILAYFTLGRRRAAQPAEERAG